MSTQDIADFESGLNKLCEEFREKLSHAELVGTLDTVKMGYHIATLQNFEVPALQGKSPSLKEIKNAKKEES